MASTTAAYNITRSTCRPPLAAGPWRRMAIAALVALLLHLFFVFIIAPLLKLNTAPRSATEVVQISSDELARMKERILKNNQLPPLLKQELHEEFRSKEKPKDAKFIAPYNQVVPEETVAGAQPDAPLAGGASAQGDTAAQAREKTIPIKLSNIGLGTTLPKRQNPAPDSISPLQGPPGPFRPVGRDDKRMKRAGNNLLNAVENEYYSFFARFEEPVIRNWYFLLRSSEPNIRGEMQARRLHSGAELPVTLEFVIDRAGNFRSIQIIRSSSLPTLDRVTREAVRKLGALPNPPPGLFEGGQYYTYRLQFIVYIGDMPMTQSAPDLSWY
ncbi:MAG: energy transducer TonB [Deltaproteobacteria bacterium]|nr:energy transducer TonB [Deltaproteobacteria bacterium]